MNKRPQRPSSERVLLGEISGVHGIKGDVVIRSFTADPSDIAAYGSLESAEGKAVPPVRVVRVSERGVIARLEGVTNRTQAESFKGTQLWIARERLPAAAEGEFYHADLIGLSAVAPDGVLIGEVIAVENFGAGDLLEIRPAGGGPTEYVPFTNAVVPHVDLAARKLVVVAPEFIEGPVIDNGSEPAG